MLSRTADHLYWMARYTERAENTARMLDVALQTSMLPQSALETEQAWRAMLGISELQGAYDARHSGQTRLDAHDVLDFMLRDPSNPSSIVACLTAARENARAVRGVLTTEVWETQNATWIELSERALDTVDPSAFFEWVKHRCHLARGVTLGTMLNDEALYFIQLGTFLERADSTARLLDVKYHRTRASYSPSAPPSDDHEVLTQREFYYWAALLRSVAGFEIYRKVYRDSITPARVAELLMLRADMPRSLLACMEQVVANLKAVRNDVSFETERLAGKMHAELQFARIEDVLDAGLDATLDRFMKNVYALGNGISRDFLVPLGA
jgi:uncharacterized alpha-E superfamily protein